MNVKRESVVGLKVKQLSSGLFDSLVNIWQRHAETTHVNKLCNANIPKY